MSVFKRLWNTQDKDSKSRAPSVEEISECQPFNPFTEILFLEQHKDIVRLLVKIDSKRCVSAADDNLAIIWDMQLGYRLVTLSGHCRPITAMLHLPAKGDHQQQLVTGSSDKQIRIWNVDTGDCLKAITEHGTSVKCLLMYGSPSLFCSGGEDLCMWTSTQLYKVFSLDNPFVLANQCLLMYGSPSLFCSGGEDLCLWTRTGQLRASFKHGEDTNDISFMITIRNDRIVAAIDKSLSVYFVGETEEGGQRRLAISLVKKLAPHREAIKSLINIAEDRFVSGSLDGTIILWKTDTLYSLKFFNNVQDHEYKGDSNTFPYSVEQMIAINKNFIVAAIGAGFAIYDTDSGQTLVERLRAHHSKVTCLTFTCSGLYLATAAIDGSIRLWGYSEVLKDAIQNDDRSKTAVSSQHEKGIYDLCWTNQKHRYELSLVGECLAHSGSIQVLLDCDGESLASCGVDGLVIVWKNENVQMMKRSHILQTLIIPDGIV